MIEWAVALLYAVAIGFLSYALSTLAALVVFRLMTNKRIYGPWLDALWRGERDADDRYGKLARCSNDALDSWWPPNWFKGW